MSLTADEMRNFRDQLGDMRSILANGVVQLFKADKDPKKWTNTGIMGALLLTCDRKMGAFFFHIFELNINNTGNITTGKPSKLLYEYELYEDLKDSYRELKPYFHSFESDDCVCGFNFSSEVEAKRFHARVHVHCPSSKDNNGAAFPGQLSRSSKKKSSWMSKIGGLFGRSRKKDVIEVSPVISVTHQAHIGFSADGSFELNNIPEEWKLIFKAAGVRKKDFQNKERAAEIMSVLQDFDDNNNSGSGYNNTGYNSVGSATGYNNSGIGNNANENRFNANDNRYNGNYNNYNEATTATTATADVFNEAAVYEEFDSETVDTDTYDDNAATTNNNDSTTDFSANPPDVSANPPVVRERTDSLARKKKAPPPPKKSAKKKSAPPVVKKNKTAPPIPTKKKNKTAPPIPTKKKNKTAPPMPKKKNKTAPPMPKKKNKAPSGPSSGNDFLQSIQTFKKGQLKKVDSPPPGKKKQPPAPQSGSLLSQIQGFNKNKLRKSPDKKKGPPGKKNATSSSSSNNNNSLLAQIQGFKKSKLHHHKRGSTQQLSLKKLNGKQQISLIDKLKQRMESILANLEDQDSDDDDSGDDWD